MAALQRRERAPGGAAEGVGGVPAHQAGRQRHQRRVAGLAAGALPPQVQPARLLARGSAFSHLGSRCPWCSSGRASRQRATRD